MCVNVYAFRVQIVEGVLSFYCVDLDFGLFRASRCLGYDFPVDNQIPSSKMSEARDGGDPNNSAIGITGDKSARREVLLAREGSRRV